MEKLNLIKEYKNLVKSQYELKTEIDHLDDLKHEVKLKLNKINVKLMSITSELYMLPHNKILELRMWNYGQYDRYKNNRKRKVGATCTDNGSVT